MIYIDFSIHITHSSQFFHETLLRHHNSNSDIIPALVDVEEPIVAGHLQVTSSKLICLESVTKGLIQQFIASVRGEGNPINLMACMLVMYIP